MKPRGLYYQDPTDDPLFGLEDELEQEWEELLEWPCQDFHGGKDSALKKDPLCRHPGCHPRNDERLKFLKKDIRQTMHELERLQQQHIKLTGRRFV